MSTAIISKKEITKKIRENSDSLFSYILNEVQKKFEERKSFKDFEIARLIEPWLKELVPCCTGNHVWIAVEIFYSMLNENYSPFNQLSLKVKFLVYLATKAPTPMAFSEFVMKTCHLKLDFTDKKLQIIDSFTMETCICGWQRPLGKRDCGRKPCTCKEICKNCRHKHCICGMDFRCAITRSTLKKCHWEYVFDNVENQRISRSMSEASFRDSISTPTSESASTSTSDQGNATATKTSPSFESTTNQRSCQSRSDESVPTESVVSSSSRASTDQIETTALISVEPHDTPSTSSSSGTRDSTTINATPGSAILTSERRGKRCRRQSSEMFTSANAVETKKSKNQTDNSEPVVENGADASGNGRMVDQAEAEENDNRHGQSSSNPSVSNDIVQDGQDEAATSTPSPDAPSSSHSPEIRPNQRPRWKHYSDGEAQVKPIPMISSDFGKVADQTKIPPRTTEKSPSSLERADPQPTGTIDREQAEKRGNPETSAVVEKEAVRADGAGPSSTNNVARVPARRTLHSSSLLCFIRGQALQKKSLRAIVKAIDDEMESVAPGKITQCGQVFTILTTILQTLARLPRPTRKNDSISFRAVARMLNNIAEFCGYGSENRSKPWVIKRMRKIRKETFQGHEYFRALKISKKEVVSHLQILINIIANQ